MADNSRENNQPNQPNQQQQQGFSWSSIGWRLIFVFILYYYLFG
jgi:hypothetical protein